MSGRETRRKVVLPLDRVVAELLALPVTTPEELHAARGGGDLIRSLLWLEGGQNLSIAEILNLPEEVFDAAHGIVNGGRETAALRMAVEEVEDGAFSHLAGYLLDEVPPEPDPSVSAEFV